MNRTIIKNVAEKIIASVVRIDKNNISIAFSGGIDSSLLAYIIKKYNPNVKKFKLIYTGLEGTHDFFGSLNSAQLLGLKLYQHILTKEIIIDYVDKLKKLLQTDDLIEISYLLPLYAVLKNTQDKVVVSGGGSDELFMGYHRFTENLVNAQQLSYKLFTDLQKTVKVREEKIAKSCGKLLVMPYLDQNLGEYVLGLDTFYKNDRKSVKIILRNVAEYLGLPDEIVNKPKKASQYGSGVWKVIKNLESR
ncbi:MAG TPA: asparagine synthase C-terminal domain-containing protein [Candidatus Dojkabacteria bacterium]|nr:asparagine synthase C-terminal domain-containing protein [Candidatus Dojkabacteria bacterium]HQF36929.1 asparagine synthase C-terminal domain-containing protein [Candidatus Dojkabacteria bacterium]